jgi:Domain of unknown function (DUF4381)
MSFGSFNHIVNPIALIFRQDTNALPAEIGTLIEPEAIAFSFDTIGWKVLGATLLITILYFMVKFAIKYHKNAYRRAALSILVQIKAQFSIKEEASGLNDTLVLLKQVSITTFGRARIANLTGTEWLKFLESKAKGTPFLKYEMAISNCLYTKNHVDVDVALEVMELSKKWINTHA